MKRIKVIHSFSSNGLSLFPGLEFEVEDNFARDWEEAGLVKILEEEKVEAIETKELTPEESERQSLLQITFQLGIDLKEDYTNEELEDIIFNEMAKRKEARATNTENQNVSDENIENQSDINEGTNEDTKNADVPKKGKKAKAE